ncbi:hypothetical protein GW758_01925 [Candidatus Falkowbacteria bacterium]|nr:hypothetical protein [Candidatus Falkowbacteria bacterium]
MELISKILNIPEETQTIEFKRLNGEKIRKYLEKNKYINNKIARSITGVIQLHVMSRFLKKWTGKGLLLKIEAKSKSPRDTKYKLSNIDEMKNS